MRHAARLDFSECAADIFRKCGLPVPAELLARAKLPEEAQRPTGDKEESEDPQPEAIVSDESTKAREQDFRPWKLTEAKIRVELDRVVI